MIRTDYCDNETRYTIDCALIDIYDDLSPPLPVPQTDLDIGAQWISGGGLCLNDLRHPERLNKWQRSDGDKGGKPDAFPAGGGFDAGNQNRGLLVNKPARSE